MSVFAGQTSEGGKPWKAVTQSGWDNLWFFES